MRRFSSVLTNFITYAYVSKTGVSVRLRNSWRHAEFLFSKTHWAKRRVSSPLPFKILEHRLPIRRKLAGVDPLLFENKRTNLRLALDRLNGILIAPGETFSFWRLIGAPSAAKGYLEGLALARGEPTRSVGGGLCQLANLLFWLGLHSDLEVTERHHHSVDLFPDDARQVPFGTGATVVYHFKDLRLKNPTDSTFQFVFVLTESEISGSLLCSNAPKHVYKIVERDHLFSQRPDGLCRQNTIKRQMWSSAGEQLSETILFQNDSKCRYSMEDLR